MQREKDAMTARFEFTLARPKEEQAELLEALERFARQRGLCPALRYRLGLVVDELVANCIAHGASPGQDLAVRVAVEDGGEAVDIEIVDDGPEFDPTSHPVSRCPDKGPARVGGMGLCLVRTMAAGIAYSREQSVNRTRVTLRKQGTNHATP
jgi:anti-sigma regulatory factor (Ser/Thr protein kinase)